MKIGEPCAIVPPMWTKGATIQETRLMIATVEAASPLWIPFEFEDELMAERRRSRMSMGKWARHYEVARRRNTLWVRKP